MAKPGFGGQCSCSDRIVAVLEKIAAAKNGGGGADPQVLARVEKKIDDLLAGQGRIEALANQIANSSADMSKLSAATEALQAKTAELKAKLGEQ